MVNGTDRSSTSGRWPWAVAGLSLALLVAGGYGLRKSWQAQEAAYAAPPWPELALPQLADAARMGVAQWRGQARLIHSWASWCIPCREEAPTMLALAATLRAQGRAEQLIGLNAGDKSRDAFNYLARFGNPYWTSLVDADAELLRQLGSPKPPQSWIVNAQGRIVFEFNGPLSPERIERDILPRLNEGN